MVDVATVTAVNTATAQTPAATPATTDAVFGALLEQMSAELSQGQAPAAANAPVSTATMGSAAQTPAASAMQDLVMRNMSIQTQASQNPVLPDPSLTVSGQQSADAPVAGEPNTSGSSAANTAQPDPHNKEGDGTLDLAALASLAQASAPAVTVPVTGKQTVASSSNNTSDGANTETAPASGTDTGTKPADGTDTAQAMLVPALTTTATAANPPATPMVPTTSGETAPVTQPAAPQSAIQPTGDQPQQKAETAQPAPAEAANGTPSDAVTATPQMLNAAAALAAAQPQAGASANAAATAAANTNTNAPAAAKTEPPPDAKPELKTNARTDAKLAAKGNSQAGQASQTTEQAPTGQSNAQAEARPATHPQPAAPVSEPVHQAAHTNTNPQPSGAAAQTMLADAQTATVQPQPLAAPNQPTIAAEVQVSAQHHTSDVTTPFDKLGIAIAAKSLDGQHQFDIRLDPAELGRVQVQLTVDSAGQAQASLVVDNPKTLELLQRDASSLNRALSDAGLNLSGNGLNFSLREQQRDTSGSSQRARGRNLSVNAAVAANVSATRAASGSYAPNSVRLDIRV